jgi:hypothetical protein
MSYGQEINTNSFECSNGKNSNNNLIIYKALFTYNDQKR